MPYTYDDQNIFARILRGEIPNKTVLETEHTLAFHDIRPHAPHHVLVIPKGAASVCAMLGVSPGEGGTGYRAIANAGEDSNQEVPHYHLHILGGRNMGRLLP
jgi:histidine triad (HIT) family protein